MASEPGEISRRRVLAGVAWTTPAIVLAVSVPRAAASTLGGNSLVINGISGQSEGPGMAGGQTQVQYANWQVPDWPAGVILTVTWVVTARDSGGAVVGTATSEDTDGSGNPLYEPMVLSQGASKDLSIHGIAVSVTGDLTLTIVATAADVTYNGDTYHSEPVTDTSSAFNVA